MERGYRLERRALDGNMHSSSATGHRGINDVQIRLRQTMRANQHFARLSLTMVSQRTSDGRKLFLSFLIIAICTSRGVIYVEDRRPSRWEGLETAEEEMNGPSLGIEC